MPLSTTPFAGPVPLAAINDVIAFIEGGTANTLPGLEKDALAVFGWVTGQAVAAKTLHGFGESLPLTKDEAIAALKSVEAGTTAINWLGLLTALLGLLPQILPYLSPVPKPTPA